MNIINLLANDNFIVVNRDLIKIFGINSALMIGELASEYNYYDKENRLIDGAFYSTIDNIQKNTGLSRRQQKAALDELAELGLLTVELKDLPAKRYIKLNIEKLTNLFVQNEQTCMHEMNKQECAKRTTNNNNLKINKEKVINQYISEFDALWALYPRKQGKSAALKAYEKARKKGVDFDTVKQGIESYSQYVKDNNIEQRYIKQGSTWFNGECWNDDYRKPRKQTSYNIDELMKIDTLDYLGD